VTTPPRVRCALVRGAALACALAGALAGTLALGTSRLRAQTSPTVTLVAPAGDTLRSVTPTFAIIGSGFGPARPLRIRFQIDTTGRFTGPFELDSTVMADSQITIRPSRALRELAHVFFRATVTDPASGLTVTSGVFGPRFVPRYVTLVSPPLVIGQPVRTRTPRFIWRSPAVDEPPGPWQYTITITSPTQRIVTPVGSDTTFVPKANLQPNAVYTWSVAANLAQGIGSSVEVSRLTFVVEDSLVPIAITDLYSSFPSPFPSLVSPVTCIWFDLKNPSSVALDIFDLRGVHVRQLVPNSEITGTLAAGRYGRGRTEFNEGCDGRFAWDGTDDRGNTVPEGVYIIRFRGDGVQRTRKVVFRGRR